MRFLIVKLGSIVDVIHALPFLEALKGLKPADELYWAVGEQCYPLLKDDPRLKGVILVRKERMKRLLRKFSLLSLFAEVRTLILSLRKLRFDIAFDLHGDLKSAIVSLVSSSSERLSFCDASEGNPLLLKRVPCRDESVHVVERYIDIIRVGLGLKVGKAPYARVFVSDEARRRVASRFGGLLSQRVVSLIPSTTWDSKKWLQSRWDELSKKLLKMGFTPVIIGGEDAKAFSFSGAINLAGELTLQETSAFLEKTLLTVGVDTGPTHISASLGIPTVALFGPTPPWRNSPWGPRVKVLYKSVGCNPCRRRSCSERKCMNGIEVEEVLTAVYEFASLVV